MSLGEPCWPPTATVMCSAHCQYARCTAIAAALASTRSGSTLRARLTCRLAVRSPTLMPRKQASRTILVKKLRNTTVAAYQRITASSRNRIRKLIRNSSTCGRRGMGLLFFFFVLPRILLIFWHGRSAPPGIPCRSKAPVLHQGSRDAVHDPASGHLPDQAARGAPEHAALRPRAGAHLAHAGRAARVRVRRAHPRALRRARHAHERNERPRRRAAPHRSEHDDWRVRAAAADRHVQSALSVGGADALRRQLRGGAGACRRALARPR